jgi:hypothetical protein
VVVGVLGLLAHFGDIDLITKTENAFALFVGGFRKCQRGEKARVHPFVEHVDGLALARTVLPTDQ